MTDELNETPNAVDEDGAPEESGPAVEPVNNGEEEGNAPDVGETEPRPRQDEDDGDDESLAPLETLGREESVQTLYALLFVSDRPLSPARLAEALGDMDPDMVGTLLEELREKLDAQDDLPYQLHEIAGGYQLVSKPQFGPYIRRLFQLKRSKRLSKALLETLAIIAYKQPVTRPEVESVRGVSVSHAFDQLQERRLIKIAGVSDLPGRPKLYRTTDEFLVQFGLSSTKDLPSLEEIQEMD